ALDERLEIATRPASEIEDGEGRRAFDARKERIEVLAHVVIARAFPERGGPHVVVRERPVDDPPELGPLRGRAGRHQTENRSTAASFQSTPVPSVPVTSLIPRSTTSGSRTIGFPQSAYSSQCAVGVTQR